MKFIKIALVIIGALALLMGLLWIGQGTGLVPWPRNSFMISETPWAYRGAGLAVAGVIVIVIGRKL